MNGTMYYVPFNEERGGILGEFIQHDDLEVHVLWHVSGFLLLSRSPFSGCPPFHLFIYLLVDLG